MTKKLLSGFSLLEMMVVLTIFSLLAVVATQAIISTLRVSTRSKATIKVRGDVDFAMSVIERNLHNAKNIVECPNSDTKVLAYNDIQGVQTSFSCVLGNGDGYIASGSGNLAGRLTSSQTNVTACSFVCTPGSGDTPPLINIEVVARSKDADSALSANVDTSTQIYLRSR